MKKLIALALLLFTQNAWAAGGVSNGQAVNASVTNAAFLFKNADDTMPWNLALTSSNILDGSSLARLQRFLNATSSYTGVSTSAVYNVLPAWTSNVVGSSSNTLFSRTNLINGTTGHVHSGADGDAPPIPLSTGTTGTVPVSRGGTGITSGTSGGIPYFSGSSSMASSGVLTASQLIIGGGAATTPSSLAAGSQYQVLTMGASNPGYGAVNLSQAAAITGTLPNANTTATSANTASTIVARDGSGNFTAGTITADLTGNATTATTATNSTNVATTATNSTNASFFPTFVASSSSGNQGIDTATGLTFNPSTNTLTTTNFSGTASTATNATNTAITDDTTTNATMYPTWVTTTTGNLPQKVSSTKFTLNPSTGTVTATIFSGALTGTASGNTTYTANNHGVVISGSGNTMTVIAPDASTSKVLTSGGSSADPTWQTPAAVGTVTSITPTFNGFGTVSNVKFWYQTFGKSVHLYGTFQAGTVSGTTASIDISGTFTIDSTKYPTTAVQQVGHWNQVRTAVGPTVDRDWAIFYDGSDTAKLYMNDTTSGSNVFTKQAGNTLIFSSDSATLDIWFVST